MLPKTNPAPLPAAPAPGTIEPPATTATAPHLAPGAPATKDTRAGHPLAAAEPDPVPDAPEGVTLNISHPVKHDGIQYGPGDVIVTADIAEIFRDLGVVAE